MTKRLAGLFLVVVVLVVAIVIVHSLVSKKYLTVDYSNARSVTIYKSGGPESSSSPAVARVDYSGQVIKLAGGQYAIHYKGSAGFQDGSISVSLSSKHQTVSVSPGYSSAKLAELLLEESPDIKAVIASAYPSSALYQVQPGKLYHNGDWYGTTLAYTGSDLSNADTLRIVLHKEGGVWKVKTDPPNISLSKYSYPDVPEDILRDVNAQ